MKGAEGVGAGLELGVMAVVVTGAGVADAIPVSAALVVVAPSVVYVVAVDVWSRVENTVCVTTWGASWACLRTAAWCGSANGRPWARRGSSARSAARTWNMAAAPGRGPPGTGTRAKARA